MQRRIDIRDERGVAMTEFALIAPVFVLIVAGLLGFGRVFFYWIDANHLANEAARWAVVDRNPYSTSLQQHILNSGTVEFQDASVCIDYPEGGAVDVGDPIRVRVQKPFEFVPILGIGQITIRGSSTMRVERIASGTPSASPANDIGTCT